VTGYSGRADCRAVLADGAAMGEPDLNFACTNCRAKLLLTRRREPKKYREQAFCPQCMVNLPPRSGNYALQYKLVAPHSPGQPRV
jgi:hypothetical protein